MKRLVLLGFVIAAVIAASPVKAVEPNEILEDPKLEQRARALSKDLRCVVCQNQSIDDSNASLARDLRVVVRERLQAGDTDKQIIDFVVARYGEFVLLNPRVNARTYLLWGGPALVLIFGILGLVFWFRRRGKIANDGLSPEEEKRLAELLGQTGTEGSDK
ncbi:MAG: cytochrome c-type biogenesis protein CcmH [Rhodospirillaceae bacterium]|nr:cytochrome c-type biogenesis protein CcmH [Rhodospirillaceae bacterium]|tara:strand:- start:29045 stop:29527 length:483 start_codon:yes stop_codon:yes gene_type:complete